MRDYPLLNLFWTMLIFFFWLLWIFLLARIVLDIFHSPDLSGLGKALWVLLIVILPLFGVLIYLVVRGADMHVRDTGHGIHDHPWFAPATGDAPAANATASQELVRLAELRDRGLLTPDEFGTLKARLLG